MDYYLNMKKGCSTICGELGQGIDTNLKMM